MKKRIILFLSFLLVTLMTLTGCSCERFRESKTAPSVKEQNVVSRYSSKTFFKFEMKNYTSSTNSADVTIKIMEKNIEIRDINLTIMILTVIFGTMFLLIVTVFLIFAISYFIKWIANRKKEEY